MERTRIGVVGCGYVAPFYARSLAAHPELAIVAVTDIDADRASAFGQFTGAAVVVDLEALLDRDDVDVVLNLTPPRAHAEVTRRALHAGKHVYSEKPLATDLCDAKELTVLADRLGLLLASAPCNVLGEAAQTTWRQLRAGAIGRVRAVYAEMDDGLLHRSNYRDWRNELGVPWPYEDEFAIGCTSEHAAYYASWLVAFFGAATRVTAAAVTAVPDKVVGEMIEPMGDDLSVALIEFDSGVVARLTCSAIAPVDHSMKVWGDEGVLSVEDCWDYHTPLRRRRWLTLRRRTLSTPWARRVKLIPSGLPVPPRAAVASMDYMRGVADLAAAVRDRRPARLGGDFALHVTELTHAVASGGLGAGRYEMTTSTTGMEPMSWAR